MKQPVHPTAAAALLLAGLATVFSAHGADNSFDNTAGDFLWFTAANWQDGIPDETSTVYLNRNGWTTAGTPLVISSPTETAKAQNLRVAWGNGETGWLDIQSDFVASDTSDIGRGIDTFGYTRLSAGTSIFTNNVTLGRSAGATGILEVVSGTLHVALPVINNDYNLKLGENGNGFFYLRGGQVRVTGNIAAGNNGGSSGTVDVSGGTLWVDGGLGHWMGTPTFRVSDGFVSIGGTLTLGSGVNNGIASQGYADISGGTIVVSDKLFSGSNGSSDWVQTGGTVDVGSGGMVFGNGPLSVSTALINGTETRLGTPGEIYLAAAAHSTADFTQLDGLVSATIFNMGGRTNATANYFMNGGTFVVSNLFRIGQSGHAVFTQTNGTVRIGAPGAYAGRINISAIERGGNDFAADATGVYHMTGGTLDAGWVYLGVEGGNGTLELLGGTATITNQTFIGNGISSVANGSQLGKGVLVLGGEASATFSAEVSLGASANDATTASGEIHLLGGGDGTLTIDSNLNVRGDATLRVTLDEKGVTPLHVNYYLQMYAPVEIIVDRYKGAPPGTYPVLTWDGAFVNHGNFENGGFSLDPSADTSMWSYEFNPVEKTVSVTLKHIGTQFIVR